MELKCSPCGRPRERTACICFEPMGDEFIESRFFCADCGVTTVELYRDRFLGPSDASVRGPIPRAEGDAAVERIRRCPSPSSKRCRCTTHQEYYR